jgi:hypothetical protein
MLRLADDPTKTKVQIKVGNQAGIYEVDGDRIHGWYISASGKKCSADWPLDGVWGCKEGGMSLVNAPEPPEPPVTAERWGVINQHGYIGVWDTKPSQHDIERYKLRGIRKQTIEVTLGEGLDNNEVDDGEPRR